MLIGLFICLYYRADKLTPSEDCIFTGIYSGQKWQYNMSEQWLASLMAHWYILEYFQVVNCINIELKNVFLDLHLVDLFLFAFKFYTVQM